MTALFHRGMYGETLRRLRTPALVMLVLATVFDVFPLLTRIMSLSYVSVDFTVHRFDVIHFSLLTVPFLVVPILMLVTFRYQHRRSSSDAYFSFPLSKKALTVSQLCAVLTWTAIIVLGSSLIVALLCLLPIRGESVALDVFEVLRAIGSTLAASCLMASVFSLAVSLCGTTVNTLFAAVLMLLAPRIVCYTLNSLVLSVCPALPPQCTTAALDVLMGNLLYGDNADPIVWISTLVKTALLLTASVWAASKRPAEMAGKASVRPALHVAFRTAVGVLLSLPAVGLLVTCGKPSFDTSDERVVLTISFFYLVALVGYYLYELFTVRTAKALRKATLWLPLLAVINLAMIGGCLLTALVIDHTVCTTASVHSVELRAVAVRMDTRTMERNVGATYTAESWFDGLAVMGEYDKNPFYYRTEQYARSSAPHTALTAEESRALVCRALKRSLEYYNSPHGMYDHKALSYLCDQAEQDGSDYVYAVDVVLHDGWIPRCRRIGMTATELLVLLDELKETGALPMNFTNVVR